jgi:hypothetical protein
VLPQTLRSDEENSGSNLSCVWTNGFGSGGGGLAVERGVHGKLSVTLEIPEGTGLDVEVTALEPVNQKAQ